MEKIHNFKFTLLIFLFSGVILSSCKKDDPGDNGRYYKVPNEAINIIMNQYYLWYEEVPSINHEDYDDPLELLNDLQYKPLDKWSYIASYSEHQQWYNAGQYAGLGLGFGYHTDGTIRIIYVFDDSPLKAEGVERGWELTSVNGTTIIPGQTDVNALLGPNEAGLAVSLGFKRPDGSTQVSTVQKKIITTNAVLYADTIDLGTKVAGHMVYNSFINPSIPEINSAFAMFKEAGISELIIDLRYNGGGDLDVAQHLGSMIAGKNGKDQVYYRFSHNNKIASEMDTLSRFDDLAEALDIKRVIFITSQGSASASEVLINGLKPHMEVVLVGDKTHGKPVGMYGFDEPFRNYDLIFVPVCFKLVNSEGQGDFFNGIPVDYPALDDLTKNFSDRNEAGLKQALSVISNTVDATTKSTLRQPVYPERHGLEFEIGAY